MDGAAGQPPSPADTGSLGVRDWLVILLLVLTGTVATVFLFEHPDTANFVAWSSLMGTMVPAYHWIIVHDSKTPDAA